MNAKALPIRALIFALFLALMQVMRSNTDVKEQNGGLEHKNVRMRVNMAEKNNFNDFDNNTTTGGRYVATGVAEGIMQSGSGTGLCRNEDLKVGRWVNVTYESPPYIPMQCENPLQSITCPDFKPDETFQTYEWEPSAVHGKGCEFSRFSNMSYCELMRNKTVAIIGDSVSFNSYLDLSYLLGAPIKPPKVRRSFSIFISQVCYNSSLLVAKNDYSLNEEVMKNLLLDKYFPDVLILNRGAHYEPDDVLLNHLVNKAFPIVRKWQQRCSLHNKDCLFIWKTTVPGHTNCTTFSEPFTSLSDAEDFIRRGNLYHWHKFSAQNELVLNVLRQSNLTYEVMDAYSVNILRPDMHLSERDCLHTVS